MNYILLYMLYALALTLECTYIAAKHTYTLGYVIGTYARRVDVRDTMRVIGQHIETINYQFVYA